MNVLSIDTSQMHIVSVSLSVEEKTYTREKEQKFGSQVLIALIQEVMLEAGISLEEIQEIKVAKGPGSYTGLRVGVAVANALGFSLGVSVNGKKMEVDLEYA